MKITSPLHLVVFGLAGSLCSWALPVVPALAATAAPPMLAGTWTLVAADVQHPDGTRAHDFGAAPKGRLLIDAQGRYSLQIFDSARPRVASGDKGSASSDEYKTMAMGSSTHFGTLGIDPVSSTLVFNIEGASFPNWEGAQQKRTYALKGDELSYRVVPRPNGDIPISVWRRTSPAS